MYFTLDFFLHLGAAGHEERLEAAGDIKNQECSHHEHHHHRHVAFGSVAAMGLTVHSFLDGFAIGGGFQASARIGWLVAIAVLAHDFGDGRYYYRSCPRLQGKAPHVDRLAAGRRSGPHSRLRRRLWR